MKNTYIFLLLITFWLSFINTSQACEYINEIDECIKANRESQARKITKFVCADTDWKNSEKIAYQIIFDKKFKVIDKDIENFLDTLESSIQYYYGPNKKESYIDGINYINETFNPNGTLRRRYNKFCDPNEVTSIIQGFYACMSGNQNQKQSTIKEGASYFSQSNCQDLVEYKLFIYKKVAYNLLQADKLDFLKDFRKKQLKSTKEKYDEIAGHMYSNIDNITRIYEGRDKVTKQCQNISANP